MTCPDLSLCTAGDACAGHCRKPQPMDQFYTSDHGTVKYLVERAEDMAIPAGYAVKELPQ